MDAMVLGCQQYFQSHPVSVCSGADINPSRYGAVAEEGIYLGVGEVQELRDSVSDIKYSMMKG